jgi:16S rRNA (cytosine967-C5)-methyltransferase
MNAPRTPRAAIRAALAAVRRGAQLDAALELVLTRSRSGAFDRRDASFVEEVVKTVLRRRAWLDFQIDGVLTRADGKLPPRLRDILRVAAAELYLLRTPAHAAVNEAAEGARAEGLRGLVPLTNGILRRLAAAPPAAVAAADEDERLALEHSFPPWMVRRWRARLGPHATGVYLAAQNENAPLTVYPRPVDAGGPGRGLLATTLAQAGVQVAEAAFGCLTLELGEVALADVPGFREGWFLIVDPASTLPPRLLAPPAGATVLDLCAGSGGKTVQLAWAVGPTGRVVAFDHNPRKLARLREAAGRFGLTNVEPRAGDILAARLPAAAYILLDAPCTNLGVIRRKPDLKWRVREEDVAAAAANESALLARARETLSAGGRLVYSVCSLEAEEGEGVVAAVRETFPGLKTLAPSAGDFGAAVEGEYLRTWPVRDGCNGGFAALLVKQA